MADMQIHFSVDDTFGCFQWLHKMGDSANGIFDSATFHLAKHIYESYGIPTSFYCMYTDGKNSLEDISAKWSEQFQECGEWMKFGFHGYDGNSNYGITSVERLEDDYGKTMDALGRITGGGKCFTDTLRLHYFAGNAAAVKFLRGKGITRLLCADDDRGSYALPGKAEKEMKREGFYHDKNTGMEYLPTDLRIENMEDVVSEFKKIERLHRKAIVVFTHECYLREMEIRKKLELFFQLCGNEKCG